MNLRAKTSDSAVWFKQIVALKAIQRWPLSATTPPATRQCR